MPEPSTPDTPDKLPGKGLLGWLGRQVGYVRRAAKSDPGPKVIYREQSVEEVPHPDNPAVKLRRTTIDEAIDGSPTKEL